jgi:hypothetical protein
MHKTDLLYLPALLLKSTDSIGGLFGLGAVWQFHPLAFGHPEVARSEAESV